MTFTINSKKFGKHIVEIDDEDAERVLQHKWHVHYNYICGYYRLSAVITNIQLPNKKQTSILLHGLITGKKLIDHKDGNVLNNCKNNLRACSHAENLRNRGRQINNVSGFKGVFLHSGTKKFRALIHLNGRSVHLGLFKDVKDAAKAYNEAATKFHGEFARLNVI